MAKEKQERKAYEKELERLQTAKVKLQERIRRGLKLSLVGGHGDAGGCERRT